MRQLADQFVSANVSGLGKQMLKLFAGGREVGRLKMSIKRRVISPFLDKCKIRWIGRILVQLICDAARLSTSRPDQPKQYLPRLVDAIRL